MNSGYGKILVAFTAGLGLALGGAVLYVKISNRAAAAVGVSHFTTTPASAQVTPEKLPDAGDAQAAAEEPPPAPAQATTTSDATAEQAVPEQAAPPKPVVSPSPKVRPQPYRQPKNVGAPALVAKNAPPEYLPAPPADDPVPPTSQPTTPQPTPAQAPPQQVLTPAPSADQPQAIASVQPEAAPSPGQQPRQPRTVTLQAGTKLVVRLSQEISTDRAASGDTFLAVLESPIVLDNALIAEKGSRVHGRVISSQKGHGGGVAGLGLTVTEINTTDGQQVKVATSSYRAQGPRSTDMDLAKIGGGAALGAVIGGASGGKGAAIGAGVGGAAGVGTVLLTRPKPAVLEEETKLDFELTEPVAITERIN